MRPPLDGPFDAAMQFFTPDLYVRFNSDDDDVANRADADSEDALRAYQSRIDSIKDRLTDQAVQLDTLCLHDAELLSAAQGPTGVRATLRANRRA